MTTNGTTKQHYRFNADHTVASMLVDTPKGKRWQRIAKAVAEAAIAEGRGVDETPEPKIVTEIAPKRRRKAKDSDLVFVPGVGTTLPAEAPAKPKRAPEAAKTTAKALVAVKSIAPSAADRLGDVVGDNYIVRWPKGGADLLQKIAGEGPAWIVRCNTHGDEQPAANVKLADAIGRKSERQQWCSGCAAAAKA